MVSRLILASMHSNLNWTLSQLGQPVHKAPCNLSGTAWASTSALSIADYLTLVAFMEGRYVNGLINPPPTKRNKEHKSAVSGRT